VKRIIGTVAVGLVYSVLAPLAAWAQDGSGLGPPGEEVLGGGGSIGGGSGSDGVPFTGAETAGLMTVAIVLLVVGITLVWATRRRAVASRSEA
jgi:hypothetical protein